MGVTDPKKFVPVFLDYMIRKEVLQQQVLNGKKRYFLSAQKE